MIRFHIITLFPELIELYCSTSIIGRGMTNEKLAVQTYNPRDYCTDRYRKVDDTPYGGGAGMVLKPEPLFKAFESIERDSASPVIITSPQGKPFEQRDAVALSQEKDITIFCGHYEGFDERVHSLATQEYSIGDYVLTGGELPALTIIDAVGRLVPGVLGKQISLAEESFNAHLLEGPQYTKPAEFREMTVPEILLSGNHKAVAEWRHKESLRRTFERRPDLLEGVDLSASDKQFLNKLSGEKP